MTPDKTPSDSEILDAAEEFRSQYKHGGTTFDDFDVLGFARAVLAKWGSPVVAGEPIGYLYCGGSYGDELADWEIVADQHQCDKLNEHHGALGKESKLPLYATPQPTQAQAGAMPLTDEQIGSLACVDGLTNIEVPTLQWLVREVEYLHGIKGGQHVE